MAKKKKAKKAKANKAKKPKLKKTKKSKVKRKPARKSVRAKTIKQEKPGRDGDLEEGLRESFPGSDPLAVTDPTRSIRE
jgi:hypothetical protein